MKEKGKKWPPVLALLLSGVAWGGENEVLARHLAYWKEGENLARRCESYDMPEFLGRREKDKVLRMMMGGWQIVGLHLTVSALVEYAKAGERVEAERDRFYRNLTQRYCSPEISWISRKGLLETFRERDRKGTGFLLPGLGMGDWFGDSGQATGESLHRETRQTVALFKSFCGWHGKGDKPGSLSEIFPDTAFSAYVIRAMAGVGIKSWPAFSAVHKKTDGVLIGCRDFICRRLSKEKWARSTAPLLRGGIRKMERIYCHNLRWAAPAGQVPRWDRDYRYGQLGALVTGVPNLLLRGSSEEEMEKIFRTVYRRPWTLWARVQAAALSHHRLLPHEPSLTVSLLPEDEKGIIDFLVAAGPLDSLLSAEAGIRVEAGLRLPRSFLMWLGKRGRELGFETDPKRVFVEGKDLWERVLKQIRPQLRVIGEKMRLLRSVQPGGPGSLEELVARELVERSVNRSWGGLVGEKFVKVPLNFRYTPRALGSLARGKGKR